MKRAIKTVAMVFMGLFTLCTVGLAQTNLASLEMDKPAEFKFIGKLKNQPVFQLSLNNKGMHFINIRDEKKNVLYSEKVIVNHENFFRKYHLDIEEAELNGVSVEVTSAKTRKSQVFRINASKTVIENIIVAKL